MSEYSLKKRHITTLALCCLSATAACVVTLASTTPTFATNNGRSTAVVQSDLPTSQPPQRPVKLRPINTASPTIPSQLRKAYGAFVPMLSSSIYVFENQLQSGQPSVVSTLYGEKSDPAVTYPGEPSRDLPAVSFLYGRLSSQGEGWDVSIIAKSASTISGHYAIGTVSFVGRCRKGISVRNQYGYVQSNETCEQLQVQFMNTLKPSAATVAVWASGQSVVTPRYVGQ